MSDWSIRRLIDRWTLVHLAFWFVIGANLDMLRVYTPWVQWTVVLGGAIVWELVEIILEKEDIIHGREQALDRWVSDPLVACFGAGLGMYWVG